MPHQLQLRFNLLSSTVNYLRCGRGDSEVDEVVDVDEALLREEEGDLLLREEALLAFLRVNVLVVS